jgi:hypothetical protein
MAHLFAPQPSLENLPVFYNVDGAVGAQPAENRREDVLLVQFMLETIGRQPRSVTPPAAVEACKKVKATGVIDDATINAIRVFQKTDSHPATFDGRVSPARGGYGYGPAAFVIANLNNALQDRNVELWPRIDMIPNFPPELKDMVIRTVRGN